MTRHAVALLALISLGMAAGPQPAGALDQRPQAIASAFAEGKAAYAAGDFQGALGLILPLAQQGSAEAQAFLGAMYVEGLGPEKDEAQAAAWLRKAAEQGNAGAQNVLGLMYQSGRGVEQDFPLAEHWLRKAASQGFVEAEANLGRLYLQGGSGLPGNPQQGLHYLREAAEQGNDKANYDLGVMAMDGVVLEKDREQAAIWLRKAESLGYYDLARQRLSEMEEEERIGPR